MLVAMVSILGLLMLWMSFQMFFSWIEKNPDFFLLDYVPCRRQEVRFNPYSSYSNVNMPASISRKFYEYDVLEYWTLETAFGTYVHRRDGPAVTLKDGTWLWFWMDKPVSLSDYVRLNNRLTSEGERLHFFLTWKDKQNGIS